VIKVFEKLQQPNPGRMTNGPDPSGVEVWVTPPRKEPQPVEDPAEGKGNTEGKKVVRNTSYDHITSYRNEDGNFHENFLLILL